MSPRAAFDRGDSSIAAVAMAVGVMLLALTAPSFAMAQPSSPTPPCATRAFEGSRFTVCRYQRGADAIQLALNGPHGPLGGFAALARRLGPAAVARVAFAMNAGMYEADQSPTGLLILNARTLHAADTGLGDGGNFHLLPNGVFAVDADGAVRVEETRAFLADAKHAGGGVVRWATQSGPLLVEHGALHPKLAPDGASKNIRNGVGVAGPDVAYFVISDDPVSLGRFARFFRDELKCPDALYFDGHVSALWAPGLGRRDTATGLGPLVVVLRGSAQP